MTVQSTHKAPAGTFLMALCLAYLLLRPVSNGQILYPALGLIGVIALGGVRGRLSVLAKELVPVVLLGGAVALLGFTVGAGNPGWGHALLPWMIGPVIFWCWAVAMNGSVLRAMIRATAWATIGLSAFIVLYVGAETGYLPTILPESLMEETGAGFDGSGEATAIRLYGLSTLAAAAPMWAAALMVGKHPMLPAMPLRWITAASAVTAALMGGRRVIILIVLLTPLLIWALRLATRERRPLTIPVPAAIAAVLAAPVVVILAPLAWSAPAVQRAWDAVAAFFREDTGVAGTTARLSQLDHLAEATADSPLFGHGFGATLDNGFARNGERPWEFELQYSLLAFNTGILGAGLMGLAALLAILALRKAARHRPDMAPVLITTTAAAAGMLIANATNPYLQAPGHQWAVFIALGAINVVLNMPPADEPEPAQTLALERRKSRKGHHGNFPALAR